MRIILLFLTAFVSLADTSSALSVGILYTRQQAAELPVKDTLGNYTAAVVDNGGLTVPLYETLAATETAARLGSIDALLIPGGDDVSPDLYGEKQDPLTETVDKDFDLYELSALKRAEARGIPVLGICKGHQLLAVSAGGALYQDLPSRLKGGVVHRIRRNGVSEPCYHKIKLAKDGFLARLFKTRTLKVNSYHHQGVRVAGEGFRPVAWSGDGLIEATEKGNMISTQFHPEKERKTDPKFNAIFVYFLGLAGRK